MKLGLGTVQFGLDYGISNGGQKTPEPEVHSILDIAAAHGIRFLDTASLYGNCESVLGRTLRDRPPFHIVTKTPTFDGRLITVHDSDQLEQVFLRSLDRLGLSSVYGLMIHRAGDLLMDGGARLYEKLQSLQSRGLTQKIGASVYNAREIDDLLARYPLGLIQLPVSVFDQRLVHSGHLARLKKAGVEIHARSVFLQGLLLMTPESLPAHFDRIRHVLQAYREWTGRQGLSALEAALGYVQSLPEIDVVICGVNNGAQLREICRTASVHADTSPMSQFSIDDESIVNPSLWPH